VLWYQGESNSENARQNGELLPALIEDYRKAFSQSSLPFLYVQLPNFGDANYLPTEGSWPILREAALNTLSVPNTGMAVTIDLGEWNDIHPDNKKDVGERLALAARKLVYKEKNLVSSGPLLRSSEIQDDKIVLEFDHTGKGLIANDGEELSHISIAAADKKFVWAKTRIEGNKVIAWSEDIRNPKYVRYAWSDNPAGANLYNSEGLPANNPSADPTHSLRLLSSNIQSTVLLAKRPLFSAPKGRFVSFLFFGSRMLSPLTFEIHICPR